MEDNNVPKWLCKEIDSIRKREERNRSAMEKVERWLKQNKLISNSENGFICSFTDKNSVIERADIELGGWTGESFKHFIETGEIEK